MAGIAQRFLELRREFVLSHENPPIAGQLRRIRRFSRSAAAPSSGRMTKIKRMNIHQLSVTFVNEQDRLLVRVNSTDGEELRVWFTRRLMRDLLPLLTRIAGELEAKNQIEVRSELETTSTIADVIASEPPTGYHPPWR